MDDRYKSCKNCRHNDDMGFHCEGCIRSLTDKWEPLDCDGVETIIKQEME